MTWLLIVLMKKKLNPLFYAMHSSSQFTNPSDFYQLRQFVKHLLKDIAVTHTRIFTHIHIG